MVPLNSLCRDTASSHLPTSPSFLESSRSPCNRHRIICLLSTDVRVSPSPTSSPKPVPPPPGPFSALSGSLCPTPGEAEPPHRGLASSASAPAPKLPSLAHSLLPPSLLASSQASQPTCRPQHPDASPCPWPVTQWREHCYLAV